jgi:hypothetical protein
MIENHEALKKVIKKLLGDKRLTQLLELISKLTGARRFLLAMLPKHLVGAEIGVHVGDFSQQIMDVVFPRELHLIDPWEYQPSAIYKNALYGGAAKGGQGEMDERYSNVCNRFDQQIHAGQVKVHRGYSIDVLEQFPDEYFDWVYIDGNHLYEYVKKDLEVSLRKIKPGGFIAGDDYTDGGWWGGGVKTAVDEFSKNQAIQLVEIRNRQFILRKKT